MINWHAWFDHVIASSNTQLTKTMWCLMKHLYYDWTIHTVVI